MKKYKLIKSPVEPSGLRNPENYIWLKYTPVDETEEVSPKEDGYYVWVGTNTWIKVPFMSGEIDKSLIPDEFVTDDELSEFVRQLTDLVDSKSTVVAPMYLNLPDASLTPYTPHGGVWDHTSQTVIGEVVSTLSDGSSAIWKNNNEDYTDGYYTWFTFATFEKSGNRIVDWLTPICMRIAKDGKDGRDGIDGMDGQDSMSHSFIYRLLSRDQAQSSNFDRYYPVGNERDKADYIPSDWTDQPESISEDYPIELVCYRVFNTKTNLWGDFIGPNIWAQWGEKGKDGDGVEYIFRLARLEGAGAEASYNASTGVYSLDEAYWPTGIVQDDDYVPTGWSDDPQEISNDWPVQFVSKRKYDGETREWSAFTEPVCWNKLAQADIEVNVSMFTAFAFAVSSLELSNATLEGGTVEDPEPKHTYIDNQEVYVVWQDTRPAGDQGSTWMTTCTFKEGVKDGEWSTPIKLADSTDFQVEYSQNYDWTTNPGLPNFGNYATEEEWRADASLERYGGGTWSDDVEDPTYMATCQMRNGVWADWVISKIKGESGMSPTVVTTDNVTAPITVNGSNEAWITSTHIIHAEIRSGSEEFPIDLDEVSVTQRDGNPTLPTGITPTKELTPNKGNKECTITITVQEGTIVSEPIVLNITLGNGGYEATTTFTLVPVSTSDGCSYEITADFTSGVIDRVEKAAGIEYSPNALTCKGLVYVGNNFPENYGKLYYSVSYNDNDQPLLVIGDTYSEQVNISEYDPETGIVIADLTNHENIRKIFVYLVDGTTVIDWEDYAIEDRGFYVLEPTKTSFASNGDFSSYTIQVKTNYKENSRDKGTIVTAHNIYYKIDNSEVWSLLSASYRTSEQSLTDLNVNENNNFIKFILMESINNELVERSDAVTVNIVKNGEDGKNGYSSATVMLYKRADSASSAGKPTKGLIYDFTSGKVSELSAYPGSLNGYSQEIPASDGNPLFVISTTVRTSQNPPTTELISTSQWSDPVKMVEDGKDGQDGTVLNSMTVYYMITDRQSGVKTTETKLEWTSGNYTAERWLYSTSSNFNPSPDSNKPYLWRYEEYNYSNGTKIIGPVIIRYYNDQAQVDYSTIKGNVLDTIDEQIRTTGTRLHKISDTETLITQKDGLTSFINSYNSSDQTSFADFVADAAKAKISQNVGSELGNKITGAEATLDGIAGAINLSTSKLDGITGTVNGAMQSIKTDAITTAVTKGHYCWVAKITDTYGAYDIKKGESYPYGAASGVTKQNDGETLAAYETRIEGLKIFEKTLVTDNMSAIRQEADSISLLVGDNDNPKAGIQIIAKAETESSGSSDLHHTGSRIVLDANQIHLNGDVIANAITTSQVNVNNNCIISTDGKITAKNADVSGKITSTSGSIGGWELGDNVLKSGTTTGHVSLSSNTSSNYAIWAGNETATNAPFSVKRDGTIKATKGELDSIKINKSYLGHVRVLTKSFCERNSIFIYPTYLWAYSPDIIVNAAYTGGNTIIKDTGSISNENIFSAITTITDDNVSVKTSGSLPQIDWYSDSAYIGLVRVPCDEEKDLGRRITIDCEDIVILFGNKFNTNEQTGRLRLGDGTDLVGLHIKEHTRITIIGSSSLVGGTRCDRWLLERLEVCGKTGSNLKVLSIGTLTRDDTTNTTTVTHSECPTSRLELEQITSNNKLEYSLTIIDPQIMNVGDCYCMLNPTSSASAFSDLYVKEQSIGRHIGTGYNSITIKVHPANNSQGFNFIIYASAMGTSSKTEIL